MRKFRLFAVDCCVNRICWCFSTRGMCAVGQDEVVIVLECLPEETAIPRDIFCHLHSVYEEANRGKSLQHIKLQILASESIISVADLQIINQFCCLI